MKEDGAGPARMGALLAVGSAAAFGTLAVLGRLALEVGLRPNTLLQWRFGAAALVLALAGRLTVHVPWRLRLLLLASGLVYTLQTSFYFAALARISAGTTALLLYLAPVFVVLYSLPLGRRPGRAQLVAVGMGLAGLAIIVGLPSPADASISGLLLGAGAGATFGVYVLAGELLFADTSPLVTAAHTTAGATLGFLAADLLGSGRLDLPTGGDQWALVAGTVLVPTLVAIPMLFAAIARIGGAPAAVIATTEPLFTLLFAALLLAEPVGLTQGLGGALILAAAVLAQRSARRPQPVVRVLPPAEPGPPGPG